jgi:Skp family chaperone for outer membrane proteins
MRKMTRAALAFGLALVGVAGIALPSSGQDPAARRPADGNGAAAPAPPPAPPAATIATVNLEAVFKACDKFLAGEELIETDAKAKMAQLMKVASEGNAATERLKKIKQGTAEQAKVESEITSYQAQFEAGKKQAQMEIARRHGELMAQTINDVRQMAGAVAKQRGYTLVLQASMTEATMAQPDTIEMALSRAVVYADPRTDITADVVKWLNYYNEQNKGPKPSKNFKAGGEAPAAPAAPATAVAPGAANTRTR